MGVHTPESTPTCLGWYKTYLDISKHENVEKQKKKGA
ncbi:MAG: hypothetical protein ACI8QY_001002, partial [bacterium]